MRDKRTGAVSLYSAVLCAAAAIIYLVSEWNAYINVHDFAEGEEIPEMADITDAHPETGTHLYTCQAVAVRTDGSIDTIDDLRDKAVAVCASSQAEEIILSYAEDGIYGIREVYSFDTADELYASLRMGYADAVVCNEAMIRKFMDSGLSDLKMLDEKLCVSEFGSAFWKYRELTIGGMYEKQT